MVIIRDNKIKALSVKVIVSAFLLLCAGLAFYCYHLSVRIDERFSGRRWSIPSKVFSDANLIYTGQVINPEIFFDMFKDLGYREVAHTPGKKGELRHKGDIVELFLKDLNLPIMKRDGFPVEIVLSNNTITEIRRSREGESMPILELGPVELMLFFGREREQRRLISIKDVPDHVRKAFLAAEDVRFYKHHGVDLRGVLRALYIDIRERRIRQGGSTITQQLAKNYFLTPEKTLTRKLKEMTLALLMETMYGKDEILEIYLNEIYFGQKGSIGVNGLGEASFFYFGKPVRDLSLAEGALLAGLVKAPNIYSPYIDLNRSEKRRNQVLLNELQQGWISEEDCRAAQSSPPQPVGFQGYGKRAPYFMDYLAGQLEKIYSKDDLSRLGLSIFTTLDTQVQKAAEKALSRGLVRIEKENPALQRDDPHKKIQGAVVVMQPRTGYILAMIGGRDYNISQFNRITQAKRQPGSAFKPFIFLCALDRFTPASMLSNLPVTYEVGGKEWRPLNYSPVPEKKVTMRTALAKSINIATVDLAMKMGLDAVVSTASEFCFSTPLKSYPSLALGSFEVIPLELARAYCAFAANGLLPAPLSLKDVYDENNEILNRRYMKVMQATTASKSFIMNSLLRSVTEEGTAKALKNLGIRQPVAGKTGTTDDARDAWFVGYTPDILAMIWIGFDDGSSIHGTGASAALPIWADLMKNIPQHMSGSWFKKPPGVIEMQICPESGQFAIPGRCPEPRREFFLEELIPTESCSIHGVPDYLKLFFRKVKDFAYML